MTAIYFIAYKLDSGLWAFDHEYMNTIQELLCNGTELIMDEYFHIKMKRKPLPGDQMEISVALEDFEDSDTVLLFQSSTDEGTTYLDMVLFENIWLCPWLQSYFGFKPNTLYVKLTPINKGLKNFNKNYSNPFNKYIKKNSNGEKNFFSIS